ncbi:D-alanyl-D-alanine carboxypeptidase family protein [Demequina sp. NBRC 110056]|uniref:M15 family metallopeptidase n=1 Tax=Demequina sp. NBRC 110056 TaxID=1570345 RepID=UPI000A055A7F|nr:M15 family metallopeptidase [Demequina sp. NBRC 110056]
MSTDADALAPAQAHRSRKHRRQQKTQEIQIRSTHRRRKVLTRSGVLAGFALAMVVYPIMGTIAPYAGAVEQVTGTASAEAPSTARALLGDGPQLLESELPLPDPDSASAVLAAAQTFTVSANLPDCDPSLGWEGRNGRLTKDSLCSIGGGEQLRNDAAVAFAELNARFKEEFGRDICLSDTYRTLSGQYATKASQGWLAATPGKSVHGWGLAIDLCRTDARGAAKAWLEENGRTWGWVNPGWAKSSKWEPWHWEYLPGTDAMGIYESGYWGAGDVYRSSN